MAGSIDLQVSQGATRSVQVQADDNLLPLLETTVETRRAHAECGWKRGENIYHGPRYGEGRHAPDRAVRCGLGRHRLPPLRHPALRLAWRARAMRGWLACAPTSWLSRISGSGDVGGSGKATQLKVSIAGSGDVELADLKADDVSVQDRRQRRRRGASAEDAEREHRRQRRRRLQRRRRR